jgi:predicted component of type VI protein secretion system
MKTYRVGRSQRNDIMVPETEKTVSGAHLELIQDEEGRYYVVDRKSTNGTYRKQEERWMRIKQAYVSLDEPLLLGRYQTTVRQLLTMRTELPTVKNQPESHNGPVERNPETGEIISRKA